MYVEDQEHPVKNLNLTSTASRRWRLYDHMRVYASRERAAAVWRRRPCHTGMDANKRLFANASTSAVVRPINVDRVQAVVNGPSLPDVFCRPGPVSTRS